MTNDRIDPDSCNLPINREPEQSSEEVIARAAAGHRIGTEIQDHGSPMTNDTRAAFEAWAKTHPNMSTFTPDHWHAWKAAYLASRRAALEEAAKVCEERDMCDYSDESIEALSCAAAIRALGDEGVKP